MLRRKKISKLLYFKGLAAPKTGGFTGRLGQHNQAI
jgi:hypothetical protein